MAELGPQVAAALGARGGGRPGAFQGKVAGFEGLPEALKVLHQNLQPSRASSNSAVSSPKHTSVRALDFGGLFTFRKLHRNLRLCVALVLLLMLDVLHCACSHPTSVC